MAVSQRSLEILVVGAGPVGMTAALELSRRGFRPRIIDEAAGPVEESRALGIHARTLEILEPSGVTPRLVEEGYRVRRSVFCDERGDYMQIDFTLSKQKYNCALILRQSRTEEILSSALQDRDIEVEWNTPLVDFADLDERIECQIGEAPKRQAFDIVIGCDGSRSTVRETLGIGFAGKTYEHDWPLADIRFRGERPTDELRIRTTDDQLLAYFPLSPSSGRFVYSGLGLMEAIEEEVEIEEVLWQSDFRISHRIVDTYQRGKVFLAGDAAHVHSPLGGRGMNLGIEDAATLAWLIESGDTRSYSGMRKPVGQAVLRFTDAQTRRLTSGNSFLRFLRRSVAPLLLKSNAMQRFAFRQLSGANTPRPPWLS